MSFNPQCDDDDDWSDEPSCPPCERDRSLRDVASVIAALAPIVVAAIEYGPHLVEWLRGRLRIDGAPAEAEKPAEAPKPAPKKPRARK